MRSLRLIILIAFFVSCKESFHEFNSIEEVQTRAQVPPEEDALPEEEVQTKVRVLSEEFSSDQDDARQVSLSSDEMALPPTPEEVAVDCEQAFAQNRIEKIAQTVSFPPTRDCQFSKNGNLAREDRFFQARKYQKPSSAISLDENRILCAMDIKFGDGNGRKFRYDDEMLLKWDKYVLFSSYDFAYQGILDLNSEQQMIYNWNQLKGSRWDSGSEYKYCLGVDPLDPDYEIKCDIPEHDQEENFNVDLPRDSIQQVAHKLNLYDETKRPAVIDLELVLFGDNDNGDCEHTGIALEINTFYMKN